MRPLKYSVSKSGYLPGGNETILLVEDEPLVRNVAGLMLREQGYTVWEAANGVEALNIVESVNNERVDMVMTDVVMPLIGGKELGERLRELHPEIKILYASGYTDDITLRLDAQEQNVEFMQKPYTPSALANRVREVLDRA